jgi:hypothetical protein
VVGKRTNGGQRPPGRPPKHGARLLERVLRENRLDRRTATAKLLARIENDLANDRGGWPSVSAAQALLIRRAGFLALVCSSVENWLLKQPALVVKGELLGPLKKGLATHQANLARVLAALGIEASASKVPTLEDYLSRRTGDGGQPAAPEGEARP